MPLPSNSLIIHPSFLTMDFTQWKRFNYLYTTCSVIISRGLNREQTDNNVISNIVITWLHGAILLVKL